MIRIWFRAYNKREGDSNRADNGLELTGNKEVKMKELLQYFTVRFQPGPLPSCWCDCFCQAAFCPSCCLFMDVLWVSVLRSCPDISPSSVWHHFTKHRLFLLLLIATDLRGQKITEWVLATISRFREGVAAQ